MPGDAHAEFRHHQRDFDDLFRAHYAEIVRYLAVRLGSREDAADVASEVFAAAWQGVPRLRYRGRPVLAWLYRVAANMASDRLRTRAREPVPTDVRPVSAAVDIAEAVATRDALARALAALPPDQQLAVHLRLVEGYSFSEVGRLMGRSRGACQMLVLRAGRRLRETLEQEGAHAAS
ncbi:MAG TPA: RNA polymerase sigma factor [Gaiellales bacterium]|nr:RNA polymerase sigma factor [Gaiellales bacterium]